MIIETTKEWREKKGRTLVELIDNDLLNRSDWELERIISRNMYYGENVTRPDIHFEGATDIHLPLLFENIERITPRMNNSFWGAEPHVIVDRVPEEYDPQDTHLQEMFINWAVDYDVQNLFLTTHAWFRNMLLDGVGITKTQWSTVWRRTCEVHRVKSHYYNGEVSQTGFTVNEPHREKTVADVLDELFGSSMWVPRSEDSAGTIHMTIVEDRRVIEDVRVVFTDKSQFVDEVEILVYRPVLVEDRPTVEVVESDQLIVPYRTRDLQSAKRVTHVHKMTVDEIETQARPDKFDPWTLDEGDVEKLKSVAAGQAENGKDRPNNNAFGRQRDDVEGVHPGMSKDATNNQVDVYEVYLREDIDGDGMREDVVLQVSPDLRKVLHITFLDTLHPHGRRPFPTIHFLAPTDRFYVPGLAHFLVPLNMQANVTINQINDRLTVTNNPFGFYRPMSLPQDPDAVHKILPGEMIPSPDPAGIVFPQWGTSGMQDMSIMETVLSFADRVGSSPLNGGSTPQNGPRTARGTLALISEGNLKTDILIEMAQKEGFSELLQQLFGLYSTFMADEKYFWATGHDRKRVPEMMSRKLMRGNYQFKFRGNTVNTNPEIKRTLSQLTYQTASLNPLYMQDPVKLRELLRMFLVNNSPDASSVDRILPDLPGQGAETHPPMSQEQEIIAMRMGQPIDILWSDNDLDHIADLDAFSRSPVFDELDPVAVTLIANHRNAHAQASARKQQAKALTSQTAGGGEQSVAQGGGRQMADMGMGNMEGGVQ